jgi:hypothetical protein
LQRRALIGTEQELYFISSILPDNPSIAKTSAFVILPKYDFTGDKDEFFVRSGPGIAAGRKKNEPGGKKRPHPGAGGPGDEGVFDVPVQERA